MPQLEDDEDFENAWRAFNAVNILLIKEGTRRARARARERANSQRKVEGDATLSPPDMEIDEPTESEDIDELINLDRLTLEEPSVIDRLEMVIPRNLVMLNAYKP